MELEKITVVTSDKEHISVDFKIINFCKLFSRILEDSSPNEDIPINVSSKIFKIIIGFLQQHNYEPIPPLPKPLQTSDISIYVTPYDYELITSLNEEDRYNLILASINLDFLELQDICLAFEASKFIGKTWDEIRQEYEIPEELTQEIVEKIHKDYDWAYSEAKN